MCVCVYVCVPHSMMTLVFADGASYCVYVCVCCAWRSMMGLVFADEASVSRSLQRFPHYQKRDKCAALEEGRENSDRETETDRRLSCQSNAECVLDL